MKMDFFITPLLKYIQILLLIYLCASHSLVFALDCSEFEKKLILTQIEIEGLKKTNKNILLKELYTYQNIKNGK